MNVYIQREDMDAAATAAGVDVAPYSARGLAHLAAMVRLIADRLDAQSNHWMRRTSDRLDRFYDEMMTAREAMRSVHRVVRRMDGRPANAESAMWMLHQVEHITKWYADRMKDAGAHDVFDDGGDSYRDHQRATEVEAIRVRAQSAFESFKRAATGTPIGDESLRAASKFMTEAVGAPVAIVDAGPGRFVLAIVPERP